MRPRQPLRPQVTSCPLQGEGGTEEEPGEGTASFTCRRTHTTHTCIHIRTHNIHNRHAHTCFSAQRMGGASTSESRLMASSQLIPVPPSARPSPSVLAGVPQCRHLPSSTAVVCPAPGRMPVYTALHCGVPRARTGSQQVVGMQAVPSCSPRCPRGPQGWHVPSRGIARDPYTLLHSMQGEGLWRACPWTPSQRMEV